MAIKRAFKGKAIVEGTRAPVKMILVDLSEGMSVQEICEEYDLTFRYHSPLSRWSTGTRCG